jgi:light-regulated signal transduction histidine kinase (bacteriophytochrome)
MQIKDITAERATRQQLEDLVAERTKELQATNETLASFAYAASHDLREPLNKISAFSSRVIERYGEKLDERGQQYLEVMRSAAARMTRLVDDLLEYSRTGRENMPPMAVDLKQVIAEVVSDLDSPVQEAHAEIQIGDLPTIYAHSTRMRQVFQNLLSNAIKFRRADVPLKVDIRGSVEHGLATITVTDNGIGFDNGKAEHIFILFTRLHSRLEYPGTGIGLALCRKILSQYGGTIRARGEPNAGATFTIRIPVGEANDRADSSAGPVR